MEQDRKRLRLIAPGYDNFNGQVGRYNFVDGVSEEEILMVERDRIAAAVAANEINEDGTEQEAGFAARYLREVENRAQVQETVVQTDEEKSAEEILALLNGEPVKKLYTRAALEAIAEKDGIAGVRTVAADWDVRSKSIVELISMILDAQDSYVMDRSAALSRNGAPEEEIRALFVFTDVEKEEPVPVEDTAPADNDTTPADNDAAKTGDFAAALNKGE